MCVDKMQSVVLFNKKLDIFHRSLKDYCTTSRKVAGLIPDEVIEVFLDLIVPAALCSGIDSACNRNEYQEYFLGVKAAGALG